MDTVTHIFLGGALGQAIAGHRLGRWAFAVGALAATLPDADVLFHTGDRIVDVANHRSFSHALVMVPVIGALAAAPFLVKRSLRVLIWPLLLIAWVGTLSHVLLDACTSYGTQLLWPFSDRRVAWDVISTVDPIFTLVLIFGAALTFRRATLAPARVALVLAAAYLGLAVVQHHRALEAQQALAALRQQPITRGRVMPTLGNILVWRSVYESDGMLHADAIRVLPLISPRVRPGESVPVVRVEDLGLAERAALRRDLETFWHFTDGYVARVPDHPEVIGDVRYSLTSAGVAPFWGIQVDGQGGVSWVNLMPRMRPAARSVWRDLWGASGYERLTAAK